MIRRSLLTTVCLASLATGVFLSPAVAADAPTIAMVQSNEQALFFVQMHQGAEARAKELGMNFAVFNANNDPAAQNNAISTYVTQKVQGIIVNALDGNGIAPDVKAASEAGVPVAAVDTILPTGPQIAQIGVDNALGGKMIGDFTVKYVKDHGGKAKLGIVGALNSSVQNVRQKGFEDTIASLPTITVAGVVDGKNVQDTALSAAENLITGNPDMTMIYATGEPALIGAIAAVESQSKQDQIKVVGWDLSGEAIRGIDAGFVVGVVQQDPTKMGVAAVDALANVIKGAKVDKTETIAVPVAVVTKENVEPYRAVFK